jgi:putative DNA primase/helicase
MNAASIARNLGAWRQGHNWRSPCPVGCGYSLSLSTAEDGRLLAYCFGGCDYNTILSALAAYGVFDDDDADLDVLPPAIDLRDRDADGRRRIEAARRLYDEANYDPRVEIYLRSRAIVIASPVLRFSESAPHRLGGRLSAMIAPVVGVDGGQIGAHFTYLRHDGSAKADLGDPELQRETRGVIRGGAIRLGDHDPERPLIVGEGVETSLSAAQIFALPAWSAVCAGGLKTLVLPPAVRNIIIAADNDANGTGQRNAVAANKRWSAEGRVVRIKSPPNYGDFNDVLRARRCS